MPGLELDRRTLRLIAIAFGLLAALTVHRLFFALPPNANDVLIVSGQTMGTTYEIRIAGDGLDKKLRTQVETETAERLGQIDGWMSNWNPESEIVRFNQHRSTSNFRVSRETAEVISYAIQLNHWTGGAFDIAVGPLVARWGFGSQARIDSAPDAQEIAELLSHLGPNALRVKTDDANAAAFLAKIDADVSVDLSAIAKGYGVDHLANGLVALGRRDYLVEIGGEIRAAGVRPDGGPWRVAIERPERDGRSIQSVIELSDQAMATSGDYRIFYVQDGRHLSHTIDPRTGRPVEVGPASVTILAETATKADAWATALMVLGAVPGLALAEEHGIAALVLIRNDDATIREMRNNLFPKSTSMTEAKH